MFVSCKKRTPIKPHVGNLKKNPSPVKNKAASPTAKTRVIKVKAQEYKPKVSPVRQS